MHQMSFSVYNSYVDDPKSASSVTVTPKVYDSMHCTAGRLWLGPLCVSWAAVTVAGTPTQQPLMCHEHVSTGFPGMLAEGP